MISLSLFYYATIIAITDKTKDIPAKTVPIAVHQRALSILVFDIMFNALINLPIFLNMRLLDVVKESLNVSFKPNTLSNTFE